MVSRSDGSLVTMDHALVALRMMQAEERGRYSAANITQTKFQTPPFDLAL